MIGIVSGQHAASGLATQQHLCLQLLPIQLHVLRQAGMEAAQYESLGRADDALLVKMLQAGLQKLKAGNHGAAGHLACLCGILTTRVLRYVVVFSLRLHRVLQLCVLMLRMSSGE